MPSEKQIEAGMRGWIDAITNAPENEGVHERRRRIVVAILAAAEQAEPAADVEAFESCPDCAGSGYSNHPDSGQVCYRCDGQGSYTRPPESRLREALEGLLAPFSDDPCRLDHHGYCQAHFLELHCCVAKARAALSQEDGR